LATFENILYFISYLSATKLEKSLSPDKRWVSSKSLFPSLSQVKKSLLSREDFVKCHNELIYTYYCPGKNSMVAEALRHQCCYDVFA